MAQADQVENDQTVALFSLQQNITAVVVSKQDGIVAGVEEIVGLLDRGKIISVRPLLHDGNRMQPKDTILTLRGPAAAILSAERIILSILGRMSGIATMTHHYCSFLSDILDHPAIAATRKTPWMLLDKKAVAVGGGLTHRLDLATPMIKDTHLAALGRDGRIPFAVARAVSSQHPFFEIEVNTPAQAQTALKTYTREKKNHTRPVTMAIMLDNMNPASAGEFMSILRDHPLYPEILVEASGEITEDTIGDWARSDVDVLSIGTLTHSPPVANLSLDIV